MKGIFDLLMFVAIYAVAKRLAKPRLSETQPKSTRITIFRKTVDAERTRKFWGALGYEAYEESGELAGFVVVWLSGNALMLFASKGMKIPAQFTEAFGVSPLALGESDFSGGDHANLLMDNRQEVDEMHANALANGGEEWPEPFNAFDAEFGYGRNFVDPDGYYWTILLPLGP